MSDGSEAEIKEILAELSKGFNVKRRLCGYEDDLLTDHSQSITYEGKCDDNRLVVTTTTTTTDDRGNRSTVKETKQLSLTASVHDIEKVSLEEQVASAYLSKTGIYPLLGDDPDDHERNVKGILKV